MIPTWLRRQLETAGRWNTDGVGRALSGGRCRSCKQPVVRGLDDDVAALAVTCDPRPVDELGEALALMQGRRTFAVASRGGRLLVDPREPLAIAARRPADVLAEHRCGSPPLPAAPQPANPQPTDQQEPSW